MVAALVACLLPACAGASSGDGDSVATTSARPSQTTATSAPTTTAAPAPAPTTTLAPEPVLVAYRVEVRSPHPSAARFGSDVDRVLRDPRGWSRAGFRLEQRGDGPYLVVIAEGDEVDRLCLPYDTYGEYSCQNGPVVAINAERWRDATPQWTGDLATYREMLVNHEVGHLLGQHHPDRQCPKPGRPAPIMAQQSTELNGCLPNPWPLAHEIERAARHDEPLAPPYEP